MKLEAQHLPGLRQAKSGLLDDLRAHPDVTTVGYGFRRRRGEITDEPVVIVSVAKKRPQGYVSTRRLLPATVHTEGRAYGIDVIQAARFTFDDPAAQAADDPTISGRFRPMLQGCRLGNPSVGSSGTFCCLVIDKTDGKLCALTTGRAVGFGKGGGVGDSIAQPYGSKDPADQIGTLKRFIPMVGPDNPDVLNRVDAGLVELKPDLGISTRIALGLMGDKPISAQHQIVGMLLATSSDGSALYMRIERVLADLNVKLLNCPNEDAIGFSDFNDNVEKVSSFSKYTSRPIVAMGVTPVRVDGTRYYFDDLVQVDLGFASPGPDHGAAVLLGGNGNVGGPYLPAQCQLLSTVQGLYDLPVTQDQALVDKARDGFLTSSKVGRLLIRATYANLDLITERAKRAAGSSEKSGAGQYYTLYHDLFTRIMADPEHSTEKIQQKYLNDTLMALNGLGQFQRLLPAEVTGFRALYASVLSKTVGMGYNELLAYMNDPAVYDKVYTGLKNITTLDMIAPGLGD
ncbi:hypothetical protein J4573_04485 [Actinomadura barringtoniae]|uniref:Uncharacterized protein n=1 Tax=Actinomadura barringtoniae TaxID=1427535 RepID=A0A939T7Y2_9ACTN|nr:hypothetical protein [Actinomadura barringtoniae]MBO2446335.1 hypothetical protein [Actinomadura barringtoniae]